MRTFSLYFVVQSSLLACIPFFASIAQARESTTAPTTQPSELLRAADQPTPPPAFEPTGAYDLRDICGWQVRVNHRLLAEQPDLATKTLQLLDFQLFQITRVVPSRALTHLKTIPIWVELKDPRFPCMCYHSDLDWVRTHGLNPEKTHAVELANPQNFLDWTREQPWMVLHELSHDYHDQFLAGGFDNPEVLAAYQAAKDAKLYDAVLRIDGRTERAYAMTNQMEYFAECSEAFFGTNDFYPFVTAEFQKHDPTGFEALRTAWQK